MADNFVDPVSVCYPEVLPYIYSMLYKYFLNIDDLYSLPKCLH